MDRGGGALLVWLAPPRAASQAGQSVIRVVPPLVATDYDIDEGLRIIGVCLTELERRAV